MILGNVEEGMDDYAMPADPYKTRNISTISYITFL